MADEVSRVVPDVVIRIACVAILALLSSARLEANADAELEQFRDYVQYANEFSEHRRFQVLFPNPQHESRGAQVDLVNVGAGNLTFARRDIVTVGRIPVGVSRVYDSSLPRARGDFGPGWTWIGEESLQQSASTRELLYQQESGLRTRLVVDQDGFVPASPISSTIVRVTPLATRHGYVVEMRNGWTREFEADPATASAYRISRVLDTYGNETVFRYRHGDLSRVENSDGRWIELARNDFAQVTSVVDDSGRSVAYEYDDLRRLVAVVDLADQTWRYSYQGDSQQVVALRTPMDTAELRVEYTDDGRVARLDHSWRQFRFGYDANRTSVSNVNRRAVTFVQGRGGTTQSILDQRGARAELLDDEHSGVRSFISGGTAVGKIEYERTGAVRRVEELLTAGSAEITDLASKITSDTVSESSGETRAIGALRTVVLEGEEHTYDARGDLVAVMSAFGAWNITYSGDGQPTEVKGPHGVTSFEYDSVGRVVSVQFPSGSTHTYGWNASGHRTKATLSSGESAVYEYDNAGRLTGVVRKLADGETRSQELVLNDDNTIHSINYSPGASAVVEYDKISRPLGVVVKNRSVRWRYDELGRLVGVVGWMGESLEHEYSEGERDVREAWDDRTPMFMASAGSAALYSGSFFGVFGARAQGTSFLSVGSLSLEGVPALWWQQALASIARGEPTASQALLRMKLTSATAESDMLRPSNSIYLPPELFAENCELCNPGFTTIWVGGVSGGSHTVTAGSSVNLNVTMNGCFGGPISQWDLDGNGTYETLGQSVFNSFSAGSHVVGNSAECPCDGSPTRTAAVTILAQAPPCNPGALYSFHNPNWSSPNILPGSVQVSGNTVTYNLTVWGQNKVATANFVNETKTRWSKTLTNCGSTYTLVVNLDDQSDDTLFYNGQDIEFRTASGLIAHRPGGPANACATAGSSSNPPVPNLVRQWLAPPGGGCSNHGQIAAHELGHVLGFDDAYDLTTLAPLHTETGDIMFTGSNLSVKSGHVRILRERN
ncbi:MAG: DUF6531 domain-containing protein [Pseudomonadota bacterium]